MNTLKATLTLSIPFVALLAVFQIGILNTYNATKKIDVSRGPAIEKTIQYKFKIVSL